MTRTHERGEGLDGVRRAAVERADKRRNRAKAAAAERRRYVDLGAGISIPAHVEWMGFVDALTVGGEAVLEEGQYVVDMLWVQRGKGSPPIDVETLRLVPVAHLLRDGFVKNFQDDLDRHLSYRPTETSPSLRETIRHGAEEDSLEAVAAVYRLAFAYGQSPTKALADALEVSRATAGRWVAKARAHGFLGAAPGTKAGEAQEGGVKSGTH